MPVYLRYGDKIKGDVKDPAHRGWIALESVQWDTGRNVSSPTGQRAPNVSEIMVTKKIDSTSVHLYSEALTGRGVSATIDFARADGSVYLRVEMGGALISSFKNFGRGRSIESLSLNFSKIEFKNIPGTPSL